MSWVQGILSGNNLSGIQGHPSNVLDCRSWNRPIVSCGHPPDGGQGPELDSFQTLLICSPETACCPMLGLWCAILQRIPRRGPASWRMGHPLHHHLHHSPSGAGGNPGDDGDDDDDDGLSSSSYTYESEEEEEEEQREEDPPEEPLPERRPEQEPKSPSRSAPDTGQCSIG